jgi:hypothetical protein
MKMNEQAGCQAAAKDKRFFFLKLSLGLMGIRQT